MDLSFLKPAIKCAAAAMVFAVRNSPFPSINVHVKNLAAGSLNTVTDRDITYEQESPKEKLADSVLKWKVTPAAYILKIPLRQVQNVEVKVIGAEKTLLVNVKQDSIAQATPAQLINWVLRAYGTGNDELIRSIKLPDDSIMEAIKSTKKNGFLTVVIPRDRNYLIENKETSLVVELNKGNSAAVAGSSGVCVRG